MKLTMLLLTVVAFSGCAASSYTVKTGTQALTQENIASIKTGMTQGQVLTMLGAPTAKVKAGVIGEIWTYSLVEQTVNNPGFFQVLKSPTSQINSTGVSITFDDTGAVKDVTQTSVNPVQPVVVKFQ